MTRYRHICLALVFLLTASIPAYQIIGHTKTETQLLKKACDLDNLDNNGTVKLGTLENDYTAEHPIRGLLYKRFLAPSIHQQLSLPKRKEAQQELDKIPGLMQEEKNESSIAGYWSWFLLILSLIYFSKCLITGKENRSKNILFSLTIISVVFLIVGVTAPAMVILVMLPETSMSPQAVLHFDTRSVLGVISELYSSKYWFIAVCLTIFSILIPITKAVLTVVAIETESLSGRSKISKFLYLIGKWSMADVFVAAIILANFAVKADKSTQADLFLGFYYFFGYCLLSMVTTAFLQSKVHAVEKTPDFELSLGA